MRVHCRARLCRDVEELDLVPALHEFVSVPPADPMLRKDPIFAVSTRKKEIDLVVGAGEENEGQPGVEWLPCVAEPILNAQDLL